MKYICILYKGLLIKTNTSLTAGTLFSDPMISDNKITKYITVCAKRIRNSCYLHDWSIQRLESTFYRVLL